MVPKIKKCKSTNTTLLNYHPYSHGLQSCMSRWRDRCSDTAILTAEGVVRRIAAGCTYVDECGGVGIRLELAAAMVRQHGSNFDRCGESTSVGQRNCLPCSEQSASAWILFAPNFCNT
jgi:hypothetical protein